MGVLINDLNITDVDLKTVEMELSKSPKGLLTTELTLHPTFME